MSGMGKLTGALLVLAIGIGATSGASAADGDAAIRLEFERIARLRIFFGHQSVGENLIEGLKEIARASGTTINIAEVAGVKDLKPGVFGHSYVGENRKPTTKLGAFEAAMGAQSNSADIALVKFCYLDITGDTDVKALFANYRATIGAIRAKHPGTTFVHVTAPLTTVRSGPKEFFKKLLGRPPYGALENIRREEYNNLLRQAYQGREPIFDLARIESTAADGNPTTSEWQGRVAPALAPVHTDDGGHLNAAGRLRAARELLSVLATASVRP